MRWRTKWWVVSFQPELFRYVSNNNLISLRNLTAIEYWRKPLLGCQWPINFWATNDILPQPRSISWRSDCADGFTKDHLGLFLTLITRHFLLRRIFSFFFFEVDKVVNFKTYFVCDGLRGESFPAQRYFISMLTYWSCPQKLFDCNLWRKMMRIISYLMYTHVVEIANYLTIFLTKCCYIIQLQTININARCSLLKKPRFAGEKLTTTTFLKISR